MVRTVGILSPGDMGHAIGATLRAGGLRGQSRRQRIARRGPEVVRAGRRSACASGTGDADLS